jgi:stage IV sporulation protein FB
MILRSGWLRIGTFHGAPVRVHWTLPVGAFVLTGAAWVPGAWLGFTLLILAHEFGHALIVRAYRFHVVGIDVHGIGGECQWTGAASERQHANIAWGGVLAQIVVLLTTPIWGTRIPQPAPPFVTDLISAFTATNMILIVLNLLPVAPLDGATAWRVFRIGDLLPSRKNIALRKRARLIQRELDALAKDHKGEPQDDAQKSGGRVIPFKRRDPDRSKLN